MAEDAVNETNESEEVPAEDVSADGYKALKAEAGDNQTDDSKTHIPVRDQKFKIADEIPGIVLLDLGLATDPNATQGEQLRAMREYLTAAIHEDEVESFMVFLRKARPVIDITELNQIVEKLVELVAGRPTK